MEKESNIYVNEDSIAIVRCDAGEFSSFIPSSHLTAAGGFG